MTTPARNPSQNKYPEQYMGNTSFDEDFGINTVEVIGHDGSNLQRLNADALNTKITTSGTVVYIGISAPGTAQATAKWQCKKIDSTDANNVVITWAGGGAFNQVSTDLSSLSYA